LVGGEEVLVGVVIAIILMDQDVDVDILFQMEDGFGINF
jgi:hypothetical protein